MALRTARLQGPSGPTARFGALDRLQLPGLLGDAIAGRRSEGLCANLSQRFTVEECECCDARAMAKEIQYSEKYFDR